MTYLKEETISQLLDNTNSLGFALDIKTKAKEDIIYFYSTRMRFHDMPLNEKSFLIISGKTLNQIEKFFILKHRTPELTKTCFNKQVNLTWIYKFLETYKKNNPHLISLSKEQMKKMELIHEEEERNRKEKLKILKKEEKKRNNERRKKDLIREKQFQEELERERKRPPPMTASEILTKKCDLIMSEEQWANVKCDSDIISLYGHIYTSETIIALRQRFKNTKK